MNLKNLIILVGYLLLLLLGITSTELDSRLIQGETSEQVQFESSFTHLNSLFPSEPLPNFHLRGNGSGKTSSSSFQWANLHIGHIFSKHEIAYKIIQNHWISQRLPFSTNKLFLKHGVLII